MNMEQLLKLKAIQEKMTPQEICTKSYDIHKQLYEWFDIDFDYFDRKSTPIHTEITQDNINPKYKTQKSTPQTYCFCCKMFLADRYVSRECSHCKFIDARKNQCDQCGKFLDSVELINSQCYIYENQPEIKESKHIYMNLSDIQERFIKLDCIQYRKLISKLLQCIQCIVEVMVKRKIHSQRFELCSLSSFRSIQVKGLEIIVENSFKNYFNNRVFKLSIILQFYVNLYYQLFQILLIQDKQQLAITYFERMNQKQKYGDKNIKESII